MDSRHRPASPERDPAEVRPVSRREFLRTIGAAAVAAGLAAGTGGFLTGCDGDGPPSNTTATVSPGQSSSTTTTTQVSASTSTTVIAGPEAGRDIKIGLVSAMTGRMALSGRADDWWTSLVEEALADAVVCGDGRLHRLVLLRRDSRSERQRAAQGATELIIDARVDMLLCSGGTELVTSAATQAETLVCPCLCSFVQWRALLSALGASGRAPRWTHAHAIGLEDIAADFVAMWDRLTTNKKVGFAFADDLEGQMWADPATGLPAAATASGYEAVTPGLYVVSGGDYTPSIAEFKKNGCEICCGAFATNDFMDFWHQCLEMEYKPKIVTVGDGLLYPHALEAIGASARNLSAECLWQPTWPFRDSITGKTCQELANDYMAKTGDQWTVALAQYANFEWAVDVFRRVTDLDSRREIVAKVRKTDLHTCLGPIDFTTRVNAVDLKASKRPAANVYKAPVGGAQWVQGEAFGFEPRLVAAVNDPILTLEGELLPMVYGSSRSGASEGPGS